MKECMFCGWKGENFSRRVFPFKPADAFYCPKCYSYERHRFAYYALKDRILSYIDNVLHIAPDPGIAKWLKSISKKYLSIDLNGSAMKRMDVTDLKLEDNSYSLIWCSHVLEHIENDKKAIKEIFRVLKPNGIAIIMVPIYDDTTYEDFNIKTKEERLKHFYQEDHVRTYGLDIINRLSNEGFTVETIKLSDISNDIIDQYGMYYLSTQEIFICHKS